MKQIARGVALIGGIFMLLSLLTGCFKKIEIDKLTRVSFNYTTGYYMDASVAYRVEKKDGRVTATVKESGMPPEDAYEFETDEAFFGKVLDVLEQYGVKRWNGFDKVSKSVLDGDSFTFSAWAGDEEAIIAHGYMRWPAHYGEVRGAFDELFGELLATLPDLPEVSVAQGVEAPEAALDYAKDVVAERMRALLDQTGDKLRRAEVTEMTLIPTGAVGLTNGTALYKLAYRLTPRSVMGFGVEGVHWEERMITEDAGDGSVYLLLYYEENADGTTTWERRTVITDRDIEETYAAPYLLEKYGSPFTAAAMENIGR